MGILERKEREKASREDKIVTAARQIAEAEGWDAVTIRRLAQEIEYSQPVLYSHFGNRDDIVAAVAIEGFIELATRLEGAVSLGDDPRDSLMKTAQAYLDFAFDRPAIYAAMFTLPTGLRFAVAETRPELRAGFEALVAAVKPFCNNAEIVAETFWAALHGLVELERSGRIRPDHRLERTRLLVGGVALDNQ